MYSTRPGRTFRKKTGRVVTLHELGFFDRDVIVTYGHWEIHSGYPPFDVGGKTDYTQDSKDKEMCLVTADDG
ncbi:hypothetical protein MAR_019630 [Mya arenaria]|uniref:Uncharacterized protein n=1 Tax=Mya arenaria TaxID=6604 RepID=A0ABY7E6S7_MYAAR|nr:hypothetical protein MAR_019630 [Mya arenaria]